MYAIEFEAQIKDGVVKIPEQYARLMNAHARVVVPIDNADQETKAMSEHSASTIDEWKDPQEDEVWT